MASGAVFLKADDVNRPDFETQGLKPFRPFEAKPDVMQYYEAPAEMFEDGEGASERMEDLMPTFGICVK